MCPSPEGGYKEDRQRIGGGEKKTLLFWAIFFLVFFLLFSSGNSNIILFCVGLKRQERKETDKHER